MIQPGGFLAESVASVAAAFVLTKVLMIVFKTVGASGASSK